MEESLDHVIPGMVQFFVHGKDREGSACGAQKSMAIVAKIHEQGAHLIGGNGAVRLSQKFFCIAVRQLECETKRERRPSPFDQFQAERAYLAPEGQTAVSQKFLFLCMKVRRMESPVDMERGEGCNVPFQQKKMVRRFRLKKLFHKSFDISDL